MSSDHGIPDLYVRTRFADDGDFIIEGQHLGEGARVGRQDYEYFITVKVADFAVFAEALGCGLDDIQASWEEQSGVIVLHGERKWLAEHGVPNSLWIP